MGGSHGRFHTHPPPPERARLTPIRMDKFLRILLNGPTNQLHHPQEHLANRRFR